ncbi:MAG TPA: type VI secretion system baseplate subunit TssG, partial [Holophaga sp.]|nr:type VI secretion system baseplate subunit TssG [Holophaga sp.]
MATESRRDGLDLIAKLKGAPWRFRFYQAIRLLKLAERSQGRAAALPRGLRFRTPPSLRCPAGEVLRFDAREMEVGFLGLTGPSGVLPHPYTELVMERKAAHRDGTAHAFLDLFSHRAVVLFYEAWQKYRFHVGCEMGLQGRFTQHLLDLLGTGRGGQAVPARLLAYFSGILGRRPLPSTSFLALLRAYFGVPISLEQFAGGWIGIPPAEQGRLGGTCSGLGTTFLLGQRVWDVQTRIRLRIGPLTGAQFEAFCPGGSAATHLRELAETCFGQSLGCDIVLV